MRKSCLAVRSGEESLNRETEWGNRGHLKVLSDTKLVLNEHEFGIIQQCHR